MARDVAPGPETRCANSVSPANGMNIRASKIEAAKEGLGLGDLRSGRLLGGQGWAA
jgi:hypothetical protein